MSISRKGSSRSVSALSVIPITDREARSLLAKYHYLGRKPFRKAHCYGLVADSVIVGAIVYHGLSAPETAVGAFGLDRQEQDGLWEIGRLALTPTANGSNAGSLLIWRSVRLLKRAEPVRAIVTYADAEWHNGSIYQASNFTYCGLTESKCDFWVAGRVQERGKTRGVEGEWRPRSRKHRYVRIFDYKLTLRWPVEAYPKERRADPVRATVEAGQLVLIS